MRQRKNAFAALTKKDHDEDEAAESSDPDEEENIQAVHPPDDEGVVEGQSSSKLRDTNQTKEVLRQFLDAFVEGKVWWVQCLTIIITSILTYSYNNVSSHDQEELNGGGGGGTNVQIAIMTIITLVGASPLCKTHLLTTGIGAFVGGQNIIGATGIETFGPSSTISVVSYLWLIVLGFVVGLVWCFVMNSKLKILDGCAGRLGTTTFIGMNIMMIVLWGPLGVVDWNRYYFGFVHIIHLGEEDSAPSSSESLSSAWKWSEEIELAIGYSLAVIWLGTIAGGTRILHNRYIQQWHQHRHTTISNNIDEETSNQKPPPPPAPLNNILIPVLWALSSMLVVNATQYKYSAGLYNGFAVGSYVAMASLQKISTITKFATVSLVAAGWGLTLTPIFVGFAGKSGFTSMMGHITHIAIENFLQKIRTTLQQQQEGHQLRDEQSQQQQQQQVVEQGIESQMQQQQLEQTLPPQSSTEEDQPQPPPPPPPPHLQPKKHLKPREPYLTKQQRRQQQRLQAQQQLLQQQPNRLQQKQQDFQQQQAEEQSTPLLHHRAWSAAPQRASAGDAGIWEHPMHTNSKTVEDTNNTTPSNNELSTNSKSIQNASSNKLGVV